MFSHILKRLKTLAILLAVIVLLSSFLAVPAEAGNCEKALFACWDDFSWMPLSGAVFCAVGYAFCKKYIKG